MSGTKNRITNKYDWCPLKLLFLASLPLSGRLVTCPWYWEYHSVEFSVPANVQNLELSVPTHLVLTFCIEKPEFCIGMQGKGPCVAQTVLDQNRKNTSRKFPHYVLGSAAIKKLLESNFPHLPAATEQVLANNKLSRRKTGKIMGASLGS